MKKLIAVAVLGALAAPAFADSGNVTISGYVRGGMQFVNADFNSGVLGGNDSSQHKVDGTGRLDFTGSEDLGNGMSAIWQVRSRFSLDGSGKNEAGGGRDGTFGNHDTFVGLKGSFGKIRIGRGIDNFGDGKYDIMEVYGDAPVYGMIGVDSHARVGATTNVIRYDLPAMGNFSGSLSYHAGEDKLGGVGGHSASNGYVARVDYDADNWDIGAAYEGGRVGATATRVRNYILAGGLKFGNFQAGLEYSRLRWSDADTTIKTTGLYLNYTADKWSATAQFFRQKNNVAGLTSAKGNTFALGVAYNLSKRTKAYAEYWGGRVKDSDFRARTFLVGMKHSF